MKPVLIFRGYKILIMFKAYTWWLFAFIMLFAFKVPQPIVLKLGNVVCTIHVIQKGGNLATLIALHNNENTCIRAFNALPNSSPFVLYSLSQKGNRLLEFKEKNNVYYFDPNRIFSRTGIIKTLKKYNTSYPKNIINKIAAFSDKILDVTTIKNSSKHIIALHNNTKGKFSAKSFNYYSHAAKIYISKSNDPDDFFIVTQLPDFIFFKRQDQNVVLQSKSAADDGSLSIYCQKNRIPYINVEARVRHKKQQILMLLLCQKLLSNAGKRNENLPKA
jgi:hypothetical protein